MYYPVCINTTDNLHETDQPAKSVRVQNLWLTNRNAAASIFIQQM